MTDLSSQILPLIQQHAMTGLPLGEDMTAPYYEGLSLVNIPGTIAHLLDAPEFGKPHLDNRILEHLGGPYEKVILILVDALGYHLIQERLRSDPNLVWQRLFDRAVFSPITSICPSTTASALTTLWTGEGAAAHGVIGYEMWAKEFSMIINNILHAPVSARSDVGGLARSGFDPHEFMNTPLLGPHLHDNGIPATTFINSSIARSGLSVMQMEDVNVKPYVDEADLCVSLADFVNSRKGIREYIYVYYSDVDTLMHRFSAEDDRVGLQFGAFSSLFEQAFLNQLSAPIVADTLLILTADHGSMTTPKDARYELVNHPDLMDCLVMQPTCENRMAFLYIKPGRRDDVYQYFADTWADDFILIDSAAALEEGLFGVGPYKPEARERIGDLIALAKGDAYLWWAQKPNPMAGRHGGLSEREMLVPFYALPLERLG